MVLQIVVMSMVNKKVTVFVGGAVEKGGCHLLEPPTTLRAALLAAGGLAYHDQMRPSGGVTVRRPLGNRKVDVWHFNLSSLNQPSLWQFELQTGDGVIFQWIVDDLDWFRSSYRLVSKDAVMPFSPIEAAACQHLLALALREDLG